MPSRKRMTVCSLAAFCAAFMASWSLSMRMNMWSDLLYHHCEIIMNIFFCIIIIVVIIIIIVILILIINICAALMAAWQLSTNVV